MSKSITIAQAVDTLTKAIKEDPEFRNTYKADIAMAVYDEFKRDELDSSQNKPDIHAICNKGADNFLTLWCE